MEQDNNQDFNLKCDILKKDIIDIINNSSLPIAVIYYIMKDLYSQIEKNYIGYLNSIRIKQSKQVEKQLDQLENSIVNE